MENPYAAPEADLLEEKKERILSKKVLYQKYRDEIISFTVLSFCSTIFLVPGMPFLIFVIAFGFCFGGIIFSVAKFKKAKADYEEEKASMKE